MSSQYAVPEGYNVICAPPPGTRHLAVVIEDQTKSASSKCSDKDLDFCILSV